MAKFSENFVTNLVRLRKADNLTQQELADKIGINKQQLSEFERGKRTPNFEVLDKIAEYFQASPNQLFGSSQDIELEHAVMETDGYSEKAQEILKAIKKIESYFNDEGFSGFLSDVLYSTSAQPMMNEEGEPLFWRAENGIPDKSVTYSSSYIEHQERDIEFVQAFSQAPLMALKEANKEGLL